MKMDRSIDSNWKQQGRRAGSVGGPPRRNGPRIRAASAWEHQPARPEQWTTTLRPSTRAGSGRHLVTNPSSGGRPADSWVLEGANTGTWCESALALVADG